MTLARRQEAALDVVVDHADVLHERVNAGGADKVVSLRLELLGEGLRLRCGGGDVGDGPRCVCARRLVGFRQRRQAGGRGYHRSRVVDGRLDLGAVADDGRVPDELVDVLVGHGGDLGDAEVMERFAEGVSFAEDDRPAQPGLEHAQGKRLEHGGLVQGADAPDLVVVAAERGAARSSPRAPRPAVGSDDDVAAHEPPVIAPGSRVVRPASRRVPWRSSRRVPW